MRPPRPRARTAVRWGGCIAALVALGAATSIAVAWGCEATELGFARYEIVILHRHDGRVRGVWRWSALGVEEVTQIKGLNSAEAVAEYAPSEGIVVERGSNAWWFDDLPWTEPNAPTPKEWVAMKGAGLPFYCVAEYLEQTRLPVPLDAERWLVRAPFGTGFGRPIPFILLWRGLALNTLFYGALWFGVGATFVAARSARRRRRRLCPACAFSLEGAAQPGCPECGWGRV